MNYNTITDTTESEEGLDLLKQYFNVSSDVVEDIWFNTGQDFDKTWEILEESYYSKSTPSRDIFEEMYKYFVIVIVNRPELNELIQLFSDLSKNEVINAYFDCDNDLTKAKQRLHTNIKHQIATNKPSDAAFPPLPKPSVRVKAPPSLVISTVKDKNEEEITQLCEMFEDIPIEDIREIYIKSCNKNFEDCISLLLAVSEGEVNINDLMVEKKKKCKSKNKNKNKNNCNNNNFPQLVNDDVSYTPSCPYSEESDFSIAARLKLKKLCEDYPQIDESVITDIYLENDMNLTKTENIIRNEYLEIKPVAKPKPKVPFLPPKLEVVDVNVNDEELQEEELQEEEMSKLKEIIANRLNHAKQYYQSGKREAGNFEMERVREDKLRLKQLQLKKCERIYNQKNNSMTTCDLHEQTVDTALKYVKEAIDRCKAHHLSKLNIITGKGNHSVNHKAVLYPVIHNYLKQNRYKFNILDGYFTVHLK